MNMISVKDIAKLELYGDTECHIWSSKKAGIVFRGSFVDAKDCNYADSIVYSFSIEDGIFVMNI